MTSAAYRSADTSGRHAEGRGFGLVIFAAALLGLVGCFNLIDGIAAIANSHVYVANAHYVFGNLRSWGWITLIIGVIQLTGGFSLVGGGVYGRVIGITAASLGAIDALINVGGQYPWWSLGIFALCVIVLHGLIVYGEPLDRTGV